MAKFSWYKFPVDKEASRNLQFDDGVERQVKDRIQNILFYMFAQRNSDFYLDPIILHNQYDNKIVHNKIVRIKIKIGSQHSFKKDEIKSIAFYDVNTDTISIFPYVAYDIFKNPPMRDLDDNQIGEIEDSLYHAMWHELAHATDPKSDMPQFDFDPKDTEKYNRSVCEFDAKSKEIAQYLSNIFDRIAGNPSEIQERQKAFIEEIKAWISGNNDTFGLLDEGGYSGIIAEWRKVRPEFIKTLKKRVFYDFVEYLPDRKTSHV